MKIKEPELEPAPRTGVEVKLRLDDPALKALNRIVEILHPLDRAGQLKAMAAACSALGMVDYAIQFLKALQEDGWRKNV